MNEKTLESKMSKEFVSDFGMFSETGDLVVGALIDNARTYGWDWTRTLVEIYALARSRPEIREISDTSVREVIYDILGYDADFYPEVLA
jgi:hypothetical protein